MGQIIEAFANAFRDYQTEGLPASGAYWPEKTAIREIGQRIESALSALSLSGAVSVVHATKAALDADLAHDADTMALVYADATAANNDLYVKTGASGAGAWTNTGALGNLAEEFSQPYVDAIEEAIEALASLQYVQQVIGFPGAMTPGALGGAGTFALTTAFEASGDGLVFGAYSSGTGTIYAQIVERNGTTLTVLREHPVPVVPGYNELKIADLPYEAGNFPGFRAVGGLLQLDAAPAEYGYWSSPAQESVGDDYTSPIADNVEFRVRFDAVKDYSRGQNLAAIDGLARQVVNPDYGAFTIGRPAGSVLADGVPAGTSYYVLQTPAPVDLALHTLRIFGETAGEIEISAWEGDASNLNRVEHRVVTILPGIENVIPVRMIVRKGERFGVHQLTGNYSVSALPSDPTPFYPMAGTSGAPGPLNSAIRFEFIAEFEAHTTTERIDYLESGPYRNATDALHINWLLGESHVAGRAQDFQSNIPAGRGYAFRRAGGTLGPLVDPTGNDGIATSAPVRGSWGPSLGQRLLDATDGAVGALIVNSGEGGTRVGVEWAAAGSAWTQAKADWDAAMAAAANLPVAGVTITIGIGSNDAKPASGPATTKADFKAAYIDLITRARAYVDAGADVPVAIVMTGPFADGGSAGDVANMQAAQAEIVRETAGVYMATTAPRFAGAKGQFMDSVHFTQSLNDAIGPAIATVALARGTGLYPS